MKKKIFLVSTLVLMAMSAMFVACSSKDKNEPELKGCTCDLDGERIYVTPYEMKEMGMTSCAQFGASIGARCW